MDDLTMIRENCRARLLSIGGCNSVLENINKIDRRPGEKGRWIDFLIIADDREIVQILKNYYFIALSQEVSASPRN